MCQSEAHPDQMWPMQWGVHKCPSVDGAHEQLTAMDLTQPGHLDALYLNLLPGGPPVPCPLLPPASPLLPLHPPQCLCASCHVPPTLSWQSSRPSARPSHLSPDPTHSSVKVTHPAILLSKPPISSWDSCWPSSIWTNKCWFVHIFSFSLLYWFGISFGPLRHLQCSFLLFERTISTEPNHDSRWLRSIWTFLWALSGPWTNGFQSFKSRQCSSFPLMIPQHRHILVIVTIPAIQRSASSHCQGLISWGASLQREWSQHDSNRSSPGKISLAVCAGLKLQPARVKS